MTDQARELLAERGYDPVYGARPLKRVIQRMVLDPLAMEFLEGKFTEDCVIHVGVDGDSLTFTTKVAQAA